ncbi:MAG: tape measure protein [Aphanothece saxicola GSE-SYN-MK-01-06B]|nr:tape measure protein [Aphanothece saxicola GSE-SYN-MK-01-06B]
MADFVLDGGLDDRGILESFKRISAAGEEAGQKVGKALDQGLGQSTQSIAAVGREFTKTGKEIITASNGLRFWVDAQGRARRENGQFVTSAEKTAAGIRSIGKEADTSAKKLTGLGKAGLKVEAFGSNLAGQLAGLASLAGVIALFKGAIDQAVQLESITRKLSNTLGPQGAAGALSFTKGLADQLGLSYTTLAGTFGGFTAAASAANVPIETQKNLFAAVAKSAQSLGLSNDELQGSLLALQQIASKGTVSMEELRGQLGERLPIAFGAAAKGLGVTQQGLIKLVESGRLTAGEFFPALTKGLNDLTVGAGGTATAAQNFQILGNEIAALQEKAGRELLPGVLSFVQALTGGLQGPIKSELASTTSAIGFLQAQLKQQTEFGLDTTEAQRKLGQLQIQAEELRTKLASQTRQDEIKVELLGLEKQRRDLERQGVATDAVREKVKLLSQELFLLSGSAESVNIGQIFNGLTTETISVVPALTAQLVKAREEQEAINQQIEIQSAARQRLVDAGKSTEVVDARLLKLAEQKKGLAEGLGLAQQDLVAAKRAQEAADAEAGKKAQLALDIEKARVKTAAELNNLVAQAPVRALDNQLAVGQKVVSFAQAASSLEQARFETVRARNQYEIDNAAKLGITQQGIAAREAENAELEKQSLITRYQATLRQQQLEGVILSLTQQRAKAEAQAAIFKAQQAAVLAKQAVAEAPKNDPAKIASALEAARLAQLQVGLAEQNLQLLNQIAPIERFIAQANSESALQQLRTQGAVLGIEQSLVRITPEQLAFNTAVRDGVQTLTQFPGELNTISRAVGGTSQEAQGIVKAFTDASGAIVLLSSNAGKAGANAKKLGDGVGEAEGSAEGFEKIDLAQSTGDAALRAGAFADKMYEAANSARYVMEYLSQAAGLAPSRFTGGPVQAGTQYRINDGPGGRSLGQEAFLSRGGDLSLINRPFSSMWTAPSSGIVLPAVLTDQLKQRGAFDAARSTGRVAALAAATRAPMGTAAQQQLALAVTSLRAEVKALREKQWTVQQRVTNSPGSTQIRLINSML